MRVGFVAMMGFISARWADALFNLSLLGMLAYVVLLVCAMCTMRQQRRRQYSLAALITGTASLSIVFLTSIVEDMVSGGVCALIGGIVLLLPALLTYRKLRKYVPHGTCGQCGYTLRGNESWRCPECGAETNEPAEEAERVRIEEAINSMAKRRGGEGS